MGGLDKGKTNHRVICSEKGKLLCDDF